MVSFPTAVNPPSNYGPPNMAAWLASFLQQGIGDLPQEADDAKLRQQKIQQQQNELELQKNLAVPINTTDPKAIEAKLLQAGGGNFAAKLLPFLIQQQQTQAAGTLDPLLSGGAQPRGAQPTPAPAAAPGRTPVTAGVSGDAGSGTITDIVSAQYGDTGTTGALTARIAKVMNVDPNAQLTPGQTVRAQGLLKHYAAPDAQPQPVVSTDAGGAVNPQARVASGFSALPPSAGALTPAAQPRPAAAPPNVGGSPVAPAAPQPGARPASGPIGPQVPLPKGFTDPEQAILALRNRAAQLSVNPRMAGQVQAMQSWAAQIEKSIQPIDVHPGQTLLDKRSGAVLFQAPSLNASNLALSRFLEENPTATPEQIQSFIQSGRGGRSAIAMYMNKYLQEHPDASSDEVKRAAQTYTTQTTAQNRFLSGPQGNTIRSLNVVVSHMQTMADLGDALKNGNVRAFNSLAQRFSEETGDAAPTNFDTAKQIVGAEVIKALGVAGAGSVGERQEAANAFNRARSPAQLAGAIDASRKLLVGQLQGLRRQFVASTGLSGSSFDDMLEPETRDFFSGGQEKVPVGKPGKDGWTVLPDGNRIREVQ